MLFTDTFIFLELFGLKYVHPARVEILLLPAYTSAVDLRLPLDISRWLDTSNIWIPACHVQVISGDEPDPLRPSEKGSALLREHCDESLLPRSFALQFKERSLEASAIYFFEEEKSDDKHIHIIPPSP